MNTKPNKLVVGMAYRLFDFDIFDGLVSELEYANPDSSEEGSGSGSGSGSERSSRGDKSDKEDKQFIIQMFGISETGNTCCIYITDYRPFFYAKVDERWTQREVNEFVEFIVQKIGKFHKDGLYTAVLEEHHQLYGFSAGRKYKFIKFVFKNMATLSKFKNAWYETQTAPANTNAKYSSTRKLKSLLYHKTPVRLYEANIPPLLRYFHIQNISPSGWVRVKTTHATIPATQLTHCAKEYICKQSDVLPIEEKETRVPYKICSFDIEASSSHGDFPIPIKSYKRLASNMVDVFDKQAMDNREMCEKLVAKVIMTAFGYSKFDDVDLVYPKREVSKSFVLDKIQVLLQTPVEQLKQFETEEGNASEVLTITAMFDRMRGAEGADDEGFREGGDADSDAEGDDGDGEAGAGDEAIVAHPRFHKPKSKPAVAIGRPTRSTTIVDVLMSSELDRDTKITTVDEVLTRLYPPLKGDEVTFIGSTFLKYGEKEPYLNHCLVKGTCDPVDGAVIESADTEKDLLLRWTDLIQKENPDIIIGYNIFGFDYEFLFRRSLENNCVSDFSQLSRNVGMVCTKEKRSTDPETGVETIKHEIENTTVALASGEYDLKYFRMVGRIQVDMYTYFRRDFNLSSYKLDDVAGSFISDDVKKVECITDAETGEQTTHLYSNNLAGLHVGDFIHIELSGFTSDYYKNGQKFPVIQIIRDKEVVEMVKGKEATVKYNVIVIAGHEHIQKAKSIKWGMAKDDVSPQDIFRLAKGSAADRAIVAKYCIQDCNLVHHLMGKIDVITGYVEMSRICSVPISFLVFRGQGIKLTSYVAKKCREKNTLMPDLDKSGENDGYEGAIVLPPKCSMYMDNPVACVDYSSLYPSSMISNNLSHDSKVWTKEYDLDGNIIEEKGEKDANGKYKYDGLEGYEYVDLEFDTFRYIRKTPTSRAEKVKCGTKCVRWAQFPNGKKGIMPSILEELLKARSDTRKMAKTEKDPFMQNILDKRQLGYKVTANSLYGQCGAKTSTFYEKDVAASTTATGRMMITYARRIIEEVYQRLEYNTESHGMVMTNAEYVYGDSVAKYTPVIVRRASTKVVEICAIEELGAKFGHNVWQYSHEPGRQSKEYCRMFDVETWTEKGWTPLTCVMRHSLAVHKKMVRVITRRGLVDATNDHSLLRPDGKEISPDDVEVGSPLLHHPLPTGYFWNETIRSGYFLPNKYTNETVSFYLNPAMTENRPKPVFTSLADQIRYVFENTNTAHVRMQRLYMDALENGHYPVFQVDENGNIFMTVHKTANAAAEWSEEEANAILFKQEIDYTGYVYDLTTENHHFAAGIGSMIVHNTDSVFFTFNLTDPTTGEKIRGQKALEITIEIAQHAAKLCSDYLKPPMELSYEKTLMPFILLSKKRYVGMLYETDPNKGKLKYMGLSLKRRDSCDYLKDTYGGILNILMHENNVQRAVEFLDRSVSQLIDGNVPMEKLMLTKALRSDYANPDRIAHRVLADRIGKRDPGNKPKPGDRIRFVFISNPGKKLLGDRVETPEFIVSNRVKIDYTYYITNQLMKPLQQLFGLAVDQIWEYRKMDASLKTYRKDMDKLASEFPDLEVFMKKKEKYCSQKVKALLFDKFLMRIYNEQNRIQTLQDCFRKK